MPMREPVINSANTAEERVRTRDIEVRPRHEFRRHTGVVEHLVPHASRRCQEPHGASRQRVSDAYPPR
jgi:transposase